MRAVSYAPDVWRALNGIFCVYKPSEYSTSSLRNTIKGSLCKDLNEMKTRPPQMRVELKGSVVSGEPLSVEMVQNYADNVLVSGPRYQVQDIRLQPLSFLDWHSSGVLPHIRQISLDRLLSSIQLSHQALAYQYAGVDMGSQQAYDLASKGIIRPHTKSKPLYYSLKCIDFNLPEFTLEVHCIHETGAHLGELVHEIGVSLKSCAVITRIRRTQFGPFTIDHALLRKHWNLENIMNNITLCRSVLGDNPEPDSAHFKPVKSSTLKEILENQQEKVRDYYL